MTPLRIGWILIALGALAATADAQDKATARQAYIQGSKYYDLNQYAEALEAFKRAYWNYEDPVIIYNIAQCHRALGHKKEAVDFYRSYLRKSSDARNRQEVEKIIAELNSAIDKEHAVSTASPQGTMASEVKPTAPLPQKSAEPPPAASSPEATEPAPRAAPVADAPKAKTDQPPKKRAWIWGVVAGTALVVGVAVGVGVGIGLQPSAPKPTDGTVRF
jgi:tetratricopeptide (TPR) repeat protein